MIDPDFAARMQATAEAYWNKRPDAYFDAFAEDATILIGGRGRASKQIGASHTMSLSLSLSLSSQISTDLRRRNASL